MATPGCSGTAGRRGAGAAGLPGAAGLNGGDGSDGGNGGTGGNGGWVQLPLTPQLAEPVHDEAALAEVAARVREAVG